MSSNTPKLGLLKKDPLTDGNDTFNIKTMLNDNWDKIDEAVSAIDEKVTAHSSRLDTAAFADVTLNPGVQIVNSARTSRFSLESIKGRTLVNLLGRSGNCEDLSKWFVTPGIASTLDTTNKTEGSNGIKLTVKAGNTTGSLYALLGTALKTTSNYLLMANVKNGTAQRVVVSVYNGSDSIFNGNQITGADKFYPAYALIPAASIGATTNNVQITIYGTDGQYAYVDEIRLYELPAYEYANLSNMSADQIAAKYPYVDSVQPVCNPYAIRYGENLLPPFYEMEFLGPLAGAPSIKSPYEADLIANGVNIGWQFRIPTLPNQAYTFSVTHNGVVAVQCFDKDQNLITRSNTGYVVSQSINYVTDSEAAYLNIIMGNGAKGAGTYSFKKQLLTLGSTAKTFKPREDAMLALQTDLYADPVTGSNADEVFVRDGQYFKVKKWKKVVLDGSLNFVYGSSASGYKWANILMSDQVQDTGIVTKYNGAVLGRRSTAQGISGAGADYQMLRGDLLSVTISSADSGWGDSYTPTDAEVKAYFLGWKMYDRATNPSGDGVYNSGANKGWVYRNANGTFGGGTATLPTGVSPKISDGTHGYYQLVYQLAAPTVEPIMSEGTLTLVEGDNQVEVGTGIVVRESVQAKNDSGPTYWYLNANNGLGYDAPFKYKVGLIKTIYKNSLPDTARWVLRPNNSSYYGGFGAYALNANYDQSAVYSVTYLMLDKSPIAPLTGSAATNEKALLQDVTSVNKRISNAEAAARQATAAAQQAFQSASNLKTKVRDAVIGKGGSVADADGDGYPTSDELIAGINSMFGPTSQPQKLALQAKAVTIMSLPYTSATYAYVTMDKNGYFYKIEGSDSRLYKYSPTGSLVWQKSLPYLPINGNGNLGVANDGSAVYVGLYDGSTTGGPYYYLYKYNSSGILVWANNTPDSNNYSPFRSIQCDDAGYVYVQRSGLSKINPTTGASIYNAGSGQYPSGMGVTPDGRPFGSSDGGSSSYTELYAASAAGVSKKIATSSSTTGNNTSWVGGDGAVGIASSDNYMYWLFTPESTYGGTMGWLVRSTDGVNLEKYMAIGGKKISAARDNYGNIYISDGSGTFKIDRYLNITASTHGANAKAYGVTTIQGVFVTGDGTLYELGTDMVIRRIDFTYVMNN
ncbi:hypothetical protein ACTHSJ_24155 [Paenibacillus cellulositrophicus]|uniref:hypothetical protein n=1 Tax=Paenibacillus cellulositrophicus TaxID=562959 RepID=UPI003F81D10F